MIVRFGTNMKQQKILEIKVSKSTQTKPRFFLCNLFKDNILTDCIQ